jgi:hypothetical protein
VIGGLTERELQSSEQNSLSQKAETKQMEIGRKDDGNHDGMRSRGSGKSASIVECRGTDIDRIF